MCRQPTKVFGICDRRRSTQHGGMTFKLPKQVLRVSDILPRAHLCRGCVGERSRWRSKSSVRRHHLLLHHLPRVLTCQFVRPWCTLLVLPRRMMQRSGFKPRAPPEFVFFRARGGLFGMAIAFCAAPRPLDCKQALGVTGVGAL